MLKPKKRTGANQYTVKRDRAEKAARETADAAEKQSLQSVAELEEKRATLTAELKKVEKQILDVENRYVAAANPLGNAVTGYEGFLTGEAQPVPPQSMRLFSGSSASGSSAAPVPPSS